MEPAGRAQAIAALLRMHPPAVVARMVRELDQGKPPAEGTEEIVEQVALTLHEQEWGEENRVLPGEYVGEHWLERALSALSGTGATMPEPNLPKSDTTPIPWGVKCARCRERQALARKIDGKPVCGHCFYDWLQEQGR